MMSHQEAWIPLALALLVLGSLPGGSLQTALDEDGVAGVPGVKPLDAASGLPGKTVEAKPESGTGDGTKPSLEAKKKSIVDFVKPKPEPKYQKAVSKEPGRLSKGAGGEPELPALLLHGEPIVPVRSDRPDGDGASSPTGITDNPPKDEKTPESEAPDTTTSLAMEAAPSRARALNVSVPEPTNSLHSNLTDLSDVSMDDEDEEVEGDEYVAAHNGTAGANVTSVQPLPGSGVTCTEANKTYALGEKITRGCEEQCLCGEGGKIGNCEPMCPSPYVRSSRKSSDPFCQARDLPENPCCAILVCSDSAPEPEETCIFGNNTLARGQRYEDGCSRICICEVGGHLKCQPRCPPNDTTSGVNQHDRCVVLQDPSDSCCTITLCDVTLGDHEIRSESPADLSVNITDVKVLNSTAIKLRLSSKPPDEVNIELSENNHVWRQVKPNKEGIISDLQPGHGYYVRVTEGSRLGPAIHVSLLAEVTKTSVTEKSEAGVCSHRGKTYNVGVEWYDECIAVCFCNETTEVECATIECPTDFGLDVLDPHCLDWETVPPNHVPKAPNCCPQEVRCRNNGSCLYEGKTYDNWSKVPSNVTGCEKECFCGFGNVTCNDVCPPVPQQPPHTLSCKPQQAILTNLPSDDCCLHWSCPPSQSNLPGKNSTTSFVYPGPIAIDVTEKEPKDKKDSGEANGQDQPHHGPPYTKPMKAAAAASAGAATSPPRPAAPPNSDVLHYPMDPGHPTVPYMGPYNPDFKPTQPSVEELFHLTESVEKAPPIKEKNKSKSDSKKPLDSIKIHKESSNLDQFPGPLAPDRFPDKIYSSEKPISAASPGRPQSHSPNKLPGPSKGTVVEQPHFIPLSGHERPSGSSGFDFAPHNGQSIPPVHFGMELDENPGVGPAYGGGSAGLRPESADPNNVVPSVNKKKIPGAGIYQTEKGKPSTIQSAKRPDGSPLRDPTSPEAMSDELYHLLSLQHPGLLGIDDGQGGKLPVPRPGHYGGIQQEIPGAGKRPPPLGPVVQVPPNYFGSNAIPAKKSEAHGKPQIFAQKDENGQTTYHVHTAEVPSSPQQLEELLAHIAQHDPGNNSPYQHHYPLGQQHSDALEPLQAQQGGQHLAPHLGTHLSAPHGFVAQAPPGSGQPAFEHGIAQFPGILGHGGSNLPSQQSYEISIEQLRAISGNSVRLIFTVPSVLVGLHGRVDVRYTSDETNMDTSTWKSQTFAPPGDLIDTEDLEFDLSGLKPSTMYRLMIVVKLRELSNTHTSKIYHVHTLEKEAPSEILTEISIDSEFTVLKVNSTFAEFEWKKFSNYELQFIDGIYLMYKAEDEKAYSVTPLLHKSVNHYVLNHLRPLTTYEVHLSTKDIVVQANVFINGKTVNFTTTEESDPYSFDVKVEIKAIKSTDIEISWSGVPLPQEKYVNIYRAVYQSDSGKEDTSTFKIAKKDSPAKTIISDLKPGSRYRLWIEVYLTNGKIKKSNVQDFVTKPGILLPPGASQQQGKLASISLHEGDYYGPLVIVAIVAALAILSTLVLLMMLMKRRTSSKADISPRKTTSAYDNPSYKTCEEALPNGRGKLPEHEMATINKNNNESKPAISIFQ